MSPKDLWNPMFDALPHGIVWTRDQNIVRCNPSARSALPQSVEARAVESLGYEILAIHRPNPIDTLIVFDTATPRDRDLRRRCDQWRRLALRDPLTKLGNRLSLEHRLSASPGRWVALVDCDDFGRINKVHGHETGDRTLAEISRALLRDLRRCDRIFRFGGDEFVILFGPTSREDLTTIVERLLRSVRSLRVPTPAGGCIAPTCTIGLGEVAAGASIGDVLSACDEGLGAVKRSGKNGFTMSSTAGT